MSFTDLTVRVRMLTRTCDACGQGVEIPFVPSELAAATGGTTWRQANQKREDWSDDHLLLCVAILALAR